MYRSAKVFQLLNFRKVCMMTVFSVINNRVLLSDRLKKIETIMLSFQ